MKTTTKIYSNTKDIVKESYEGFSVGLEIDGKWVDFMNLQKKENFLAFCNDAKEAGLSPEETAWNITIAALWNVQYLAEQVAIKVHQDLEDVWKRLDAIEAASKS